MAIENFLSNVFGPPSSIVKSVFDCRLFGVSILDWYLVFCSPPIQTTGENVSPTHILISHILYCMGMFFYICFMVITEK